MHKIFKEHTGLKECFETADGCVFYTENAARNHAKTLDDKTVTHHVNEHQEKQSDTATEKPLNRMNRQELLEKASTLEVDVPEDATKPQIIELINAVADEDEVIKTDEDEVIKTEE